LATAFEELILRTARLVLVAATPRHLSTEIEAPDQLPALLGARISSSWPTGEYDRGAMDYFLKQLEAGGKSAKGWYSWYAILPGGETSDLVGSGGYLGPPGADRTVEIGFSVLPEFQRRGYAREIVEALVARAFAEPVVDRVIAHTTCANTASIAVLRHCGFSLVDEATSGAVRYERLRAA
jgi:RimJ/RimL family protein N-acetyltransferase